MTLSPIGDSPLLTDRVYSAIRQSILNGDLPAGTRLRIRNLAAQVGTSVMPVREAIGKLEEAGLAERIPHRGAVVKGLTLEELVHVYDVRLLLEVEAARLGARNISNTHARLMGDHLSAMRTSIADGRVVDVLDQDEELLSVLYTASANPVLVQTIRGLWHTCRAYKLVGAAGTMSSARPDSLWRYQEQLVEAALRNDDIGAARATTASLVDATGRIRTLLE